MSSLSSIQVIDLCAQHHTCQFAPMFLYDYGQARISSVLKLLEDAVMG